MMRLLLRRHKAGFLNTLSVRLFLQIGRHRDRFNEAFISSSSILSGLAVALEMDVVFKTVGPATLIS